MAMRHCKECGNAVSTNAKCCPNCGSMKWRGSSLGKALGLIVVFVLGLAIIGAQNDGSNTPRSVSASQSAHDASRSPPQRSSVQSDSEYPFKLVTILSMDQEFLGAMCSLRDDGKGWHKSEFDGVWNATLRRSFGPNEVSCLIESTRVSRVERVELEAEFYKPSYGDAEMTRQFAQSAQVLMHPLQPSKEFAEALAHKSEWSGNGWSLSRIPYANGGFGFMLRSDTK